MVNQPEPFEQLAIDESLTDVRIQVYHRPWATVPVKNDVSVLVV